MVRAFWVCLLALAMTPLWAAPAAAKSRLFADDAPLQIVVTAPFGALVKTAKANTNPYPATLSLTDGAGPALSLPIQVRARGLTRRTAGYCQFPPLSLILGDAAPHGSIVQGQHRLKLVTYCRTPPDYEQRIILEYLAYRLYNVVTPMSFRVRAAQVTYHSTDGGADVTRFGFLIEDIDDVADRNHGDELKAVTHEVSSSQLDPKAAARAALFEFMIGNLDWEFLAAPAGFDCCHNIRLIAARDAIVATARGVTPVPYDFDYSGFVDAPYSGVPEAIPVTKLTERYYRGYCVSTAEVPAVVEEYRSHKAEMMAVINAEARLNPSFRGKTVKFLEGFFGLLDDPARVQRQIVKHCR